MATATVAAPALAVARPYPPSWFDRLKGSIERSGRRWWAWYVVGAAIPVPIVAVVAWAAGMYPPGTFHPFHVFLAMLPAATLWYMHLLDRVAERAVAQMAPKLAAEPALIERLTYSLTTMPARPALLLGVVGAASAVATIIAIYAIDQGGEFLAVFGFTRAPLSVATFGAIMAAGYGFGFVFAYHAVRQLRQISRTYERDVVIDLIDLGPIYAFSRITALTALGIQLQADLWIVTNPVAAGALVPVASVAALTLLSAVIFILPLWGIHRRISTEKGRLLQANAGVRQVLMDDLRRRVAADDLGGVTALKDAVLALEVEARALAAIRTWPWEPETLRLLLTAVLLPTTLFVVQYVVRELLGP